MSGIRMLERFWARAKVVHNGLVQAFMMDYNPDN